MAPAGNRSTLGAREGGVPLTEIAGRPARSRRSIRVVLLVAGLGLVTAGAVALQARAQVAATSRSADAGLSAALSGAAARGLDRGLFTSSPGGIVATAARVDQWRSHIVRATRGSGVDPNTLEALVFVESSGRPDVIAGSDVSSAAGLTQIVASTGSRFLHMRVHLGKSRKLTQQIDRSEARGSRIRARQLRTWRRRYDERFAPAESLRATVRYLTTARRYLGRDDLAVEAYHMGIGNLQDV
ncbi:MAG: hypothetical protein QOF43_820, partial [Gaiellaceae bacterium]|nr:hypothetical protein [Gaiellaceae bacterium]